MELTKEEALRLENLNLQRQIIDLSHQREAHRIEQDLKTLELEIKDRLNLGYNDKLNVDLSKRQVFVTQEAPTQVAGEVDALAADHSN